MGEVKRVVSSLTQMLDRGQKEAKSLVGIMDELQSYLEEESNTIICGGLDRLLSRIRVEVGNLVGGSARVLVSPDGRVTVGTTYSDEDSDSRLKRLKAQDFCILRPDGFSAFITSLKSEVAAGNWMPVIEFLRANAKFGAAPAYSPAPALRESPPPEPSTSSEWKLSDFLPARPPLPPLPRGLFKH
ncbi:unnamed protein product [marine sediment metagenome]|uniref:Uncharacterized protein n=1 Tax=marine sediment metagenome TaxID=412755 RepID=X1V4R1_9ZZZZ